MIQIKTRFKIYRTSTDMWEMIHYLCEHTFLMKKKWSWKELHSNWRIFKLYCLYLQQNTANVSISIMNTTYRNRMEKTNQCGQITTFVTLAPCQSASRITLLPTMSSGFATTFAQSKPWRWSVHVWPQG